MRPVQSSCHYSPSRPCLAPCCSGGLAGLAKKVLVVGVVAAGVAFALQQVGKKQGDKKQGVAAGDKGKKK